MSLERVTNMIAVSTLSFGFVKKSPLWVRCAFGFWLCQDNYINGKLIFTIKDSYYCLRLRVEHRLVLKLSTLNPLISFYCWGNLISKPSVSAFAYSSFRCYVPSRENGFFIGFLNELLVVDFHVRESLFYLLHYLRLFLSSVHRGLFAYRRSECTRE